MDNIRNIFGDRNGSSVGLETAKTIQTNSSLTQATSLSLSKSSTIVQKTSPSDSRYGHSTTYGVGDKPRNRTVSESSNNSDTSSVASNSSFDRRNGKDSESYFWIMWHN